MTKTTMTVTKPQNGVRKVYLDILIHFTGKLSKSMTNSLDKMTYTISGNVVGNRSMPRKITICYKETSRRSVISIEEVGSNFNNEIIIEESDTDLIPRKIIIEESDTNSIIIEESDTNSIIISIPKGKTSSANGVLTRSETENARQ